MCIGGTLYSMDTLLTALDELLSVQFNLNACYCKINSAKDHLIYCVTKNLTNHTFSEEQESTVLDLCNQLKATLSKRPFTIALYLKVQKLMDSLKLYTDSIEGDS